MRVSELEGALLDYWVARSEGLPLSAEWDSYTGDGILIGTGAGDLEPFAPSTDWSCGGPVIEREKIDIQCGGWEWGAWRGSNPDWQPAGDAFGDTPLIAAMRAYVASKFGDEVPDESK